MEVFLAVALVAYVLTKAVSDARLDHTYAKQGQVSPRLQAKYGGEAAAREKTRRYGLLDYFGDAWSDHWQRRAAALEADRAAYLADPGPRVRLRDRLAAAKRVMAATPAAVATGYRKFVDPVPAKSDRPAAEPVTPGPASRLVDTGDVPVGTVRHTEAGRERWTGSDWEPVDDRPSGPATRRFDGQPETDVDRRFFDLRESGYTGWIDQDGYAVDGPPFERTDAEHPDSTNAPTGGTMSAPTGEAVNYETTVNELEKLAAEQRGHIDACQAALKAISDAKSAINNMQESYRASSAAAGSMADHLAAKNLDSTTLAHAGTTVDAMPAGVVDQMYDQLEGMEAEAAARLGEAEAALGSTEANLAHVQSTYGAAHETVAGNLSGDSSFLDSAGGVAGGGTATGGAGGGYSGGGAVREPVGAGVGGGSAVGDTASVKGG